MKNFIATLLIIFFAANNVVFAATKSYDFSDDAQNKYKPKTSTETTAANTIEPLRGSVLKIEKGSSFNASLQSSLNTASANKGDNITAVLMENISANGIVLAPRGSLVYGKITKAKTSGYAYGNGQISINFNQVVPMSGEALKISTEKINFNIGIESSQAVEVSKRAVTGAVIGALTGVIIGAITGDYGKSIAVSTGVGAAGGVVNAGFQKGQDLEIPQSTVIQLKLTKPLTLNYNH